MGASGLRVSALGLGTMTWGRDTDEHEAADQIRAFVDAGGALVETAAHYGDGAAEALLGSFLGTAVDRSEVTITTTAGVRAGRPDASRGNLLDTLDASLARLRTDHVDLWLVQAPDAHTPAHETVDALSIAVRSGRARYVGVANHPGWATGRLGALLSAAGGPGLAAVEAEYSLLERGIEREVLPAAVALGAGVLAWSPLGRGVLAGRYRHHVPADSRAASVHLRGFVEPYLNDTCYGVVEAVATAADGLGWSAAEVALSWVAGAPGIACAIVGARTAAQLRGVLPAAQRTLPGAIRAALAETTAPVLGYPER